MESVNIVFDKEIIHNNNYVLNQQDKEYVLDFYTGNLFPVNFDASIATFDYHLPLSKLISKYYPGFKINEISSNQLKKNEKFIYAVNFKYLNDYLSNNSMPVLFSNLKENIRAGILNQDGILLLNDSHEFASYINFKQVSFNNSLQSFKSLDKTVLPKIFISSSNLDNEKYTGTVYLGDDYSLKHRLSNAVLNTFYEAHRYKSINIFGFRYFEEVVAAQTKAFYPDYTYSLKLDKLLNNEIKHFICLNNITKDFRTVLTYLVYVQSLSKNFHISHRQVRQNLYNELNESDWSGLISKRLFSDFASELPYNLDVSDYIDNPWNIVPWQQVNNSFCWLVTETLYEGDIYSRCFFTEKTYKPMSIFMPFMLVAQPYSLYNLKKEGYATFSKWWDESYDGELDKIKRMEKIMQNVIAICKLDNHSLINMYKDMKDVLEHNYNHLMHTTAAKRYIDKLVNVYLVK